MIWFACFTFAVLWLHSLHKLMGCVHLISAFCRYLSNFSSLLSATCTVSYVTSKSPGSSLTYFLFSQPTSAISEVSLLYATLLWFCPGSRSLFFSVGCCRAKLNLFGVSVLGCCCDSTTAFRTTLCMCLCLDRRGTFWQKDFSTGISDMRGNWAGCKIPRFVAISMTFTIQL